MSKHTRGPWRWDKGQGVITAEWNGFPWHIATVDMSELGWHENEQCKARENGANARLIAAAPLMLDALENLVMAIELPGEHCEVEQAMRQARAALQAAKGGDGEASV